jgi:hypothetical protein
MPKFINQASRPVDNDLRRRAFQAAGWEQAAAKTTAADWRLRIHAEGVYKPFERTEDYLHW